MKNNDPIICRCEEVTYDDLMVAVQNGARSSQELKMATRAGMGMCQGRICRHFLEIIACENQPGILLHPTKLTIHNPVRPVKLSMVGAGRNDSCE